MSHLSIIQEVGGLIGVHADTGYYQVHHDPVTDDWQVTSKDDQTVQGDWMKTRDDAIKFVMERTNLLEDANYQRAPDRTSA
jgi:ClpP class serine protease